LRKNEEKGDLENVVSGQIRGANFFRQKVWRQKLRHRCHLKALIIRSTSKFLKLRFFKFRETAFCSEIYGVTSNDDTLNKPGLCLEMEVGAGQYAKS